MQAVVRYQLSHLVNLIPHKKDFYLSLYPEAKAKGNVELKSGVKAPTLCLGVLVSVKSQKELFSCFSKEKA